MAELGQGQVFAVLLATLKPIASMLMRFGISYRDFDRVSRLAFVEAAAESGGPSATNNASRIALRTGLSRKAVRAVQEDSKMVGLPEVDIRSLPSEILHVWHTDKRFIDRPGVPRPLYWEVGGDSFCELVKLCTTSVPPSTIRDELLQVGAIEENGQVLVAKRRSFIPITSQQRLIQGLQYGIRPLALTVAHNAATNDPRSVRFQRIVWNYCLPREKRGEVDRVITRKLEEISQEIDDLLAEVEVARGSKESSVFGVGLYHFEDDPSDVSGGTSNA